MSYQCKILLDSISPTGKRLTTFEITFPRIVLAEFNTHRMFSRNSASSRAIPFKKQIERVLNNPFIPEKFPIDGKGMQPNSYIDKEHEFYPALVREWLDCRDSTVSSARDLYNGVFGDPNNLSHIHKQLVNRLLEPFQYHTCIITATEFNNFFKLRTHPDAQYEIRRIADLMYEAYHAFDNETWSAVVRHTKLPEMTDKLGVYKDNGWTAVRPRKLKVGEWHCPLVYEEDTPLVESYIETESRKYYENGPTATTIIPDQFPIGKYVIEFKKRISVARCARVSYLTHDGKRDIEKDLDLFERLRTSGHWSPFEHVASPYFLSSDIGGNNPRMAYQTIEDRNLEEDLRSGNFIGWKQFRKEFADENCASFKKE